MPSLSKWAECFSRGFRRKRMSRLAGAARLTGEMRVLDVGGTPDIWLLLDQRPRIVFLNLPRTRDEVLDGLPWAGRVYGDGRKLPFADRSFDLVFSNSVIEHLGGAASQREFAAEVRRVGRGFWVQTPNRRFPFETHLLTPLVHLLPRRWQRWLVPRFTVWELVRRPRPDQREFYLRHYLDDIRLLTEGELHGLFPEAAIVHERFLGLVKSLVAFRPPG